MAKAGIAITLNPVECGIPPLQSKTQQSHNGHYQPGTEISAPI